MIVPSKKNKQWSNLCKFDVTAKIVEYMVISCFGTFLTPKMRSFKGKTVSMNILFSKSLCQEFFIYLIFETSLSRGNRRFSFHSLIRRLRKLFSAIRKQFFQSGDILENIQKFLNIFQNPGRPRSLRFWGWFFHRIKTRFYMDF